MQIRGLAVVWLFLLAAVVEADQYYSCTDGGGNKSFQSDPCATGELEEVRVIAGVPASEKKLLKSSRSYMNDASSICSEKWTKRGVRNDRMYRYCMGEQREGYDDLVLLAKTHAKKDFFIERSWPYCSDRWTKRGVVDSRMLVHCLNEEVEGVRDVNYYGEKYGDSIYDIAGRALERYGSWNMAAYMVKQSLER